MALLRWWYLCHLAIRTRGAATATYQQTAPQHYIYHWTREGRQTGLSQCPGSQKPWRIDHISLQEIHSHWSLYPFPFTLPPEKNHRSVKMYARQGPLDSWHHTQGTQTTTPPTCLQANGFTDYLVRKTLAHQLPPITPSRSISEEPPKILCVPYVRGLNEKLERVAPSWCQSSIQSHGDAQIGPEETKEPYSKGE